MAWRKEKSQKGILLDELTMMLFTVCVSGRVGRPFFVSTCHVRSCVSLRRGDAGVRRTPWGDLPARDASSCGTRTVSAAQAALDDGSTHVGVLHNTFQHIMHLFLPDMHA